MIEFKKKGTDATTPHMVTPEEPLSAETEPIVKRVATGAIVITDDEIFFPQNFPEGLYYIVQYARIERKKS